jgi:hypothetical protein
MLFFFNLCGGTLGTGAITGLLYQSLMIGDGDCREIGGVKIGRGNRSTRRKPAPVLLCLPQLNPGRRCGKPATNRLSYGAAFPKHVDPMPSERGQLTEICKGSKYIQIELYWTVLTICNLVY